MEIDKLSEILRSYTDKIKYNSGFASFKRNYVSNDYVNVKGNEATFYGTVFDEHHRKSYTSMISINTYARTISVSYTHLDVYKRQDFSFMYVSTNSTNKFFHLLHSF